MTTRDQPLTDCQIRPFNAGDIEAVLRLWASCEGLGRGPGDTVDALSRFLERNPGLSLVAVDGRTTAAAVLCGHDARRGYIYHLAVAMQYRRRGLAFELVRRCLSGLKAAGIERCQVFVQSDNVVATKFWQAMGGKLRTDLHVLSIQL